MFAVDTGSVAALLLQIALVVARVGIIFVGVYSQLMIDNVQRLVAPLVALAPVTLK
jgi:hypothetical protein